MYKVNVTKLVKNSTESTKSVNNLSLTKDQFTSLLVENLITFPLVRKSITTEGKAKFYFANETETNSTKISVIVEEVVS